MGLTRAVEALENAIARNESRLRDLILRQGSGLAHHGLTPDDMLDNTGRPILLEARIALVNGLAAIARAK